MYSWWGSAIFTEDWMILSAKSVSPVQLDNSTALCVKKPKGSCSWYLTLLLLRWVFGETVYQMNDTGTGRPKNVTLPSSVLFLSIDADTRKVANAFFLTDEAGYPRPLIHSHNSNSTVVPTASIVMNKIYYQWYRNVTKHSTGSHFAAGLAVDSNGDPFVKMEVVFPPIPNVTAPTVAHTNGTSSSYVYFFFAKSDGFVSSTYLTVARLHVSQLGNTSLPFEYWAGGDSWNLGSYQVPTLDAIGTSFSIAWNPYCQLFLTLDTGPGTRAVLRSSVTVYKDFTLPMTLYPTIESSEQLTTAQWHPELFEENGRIMYASVYSGTRPYPTLLRIELQPDSS